MIVITGQAPIDKFDTTDFNNPMAFRSLQTSSFSIKNDLTHYALPYSYNSSMP